MKRANLLITAARGGLVLLLLFSLSIGGRGDAGHDSDEEEEQEIQEILRQSTLRPSERVENPPPFPLQSERVASFIREHLSCKEGNVAVLLLQPGFRHTVLLANLIGEELTKKGVPTIGIVKGERATTDVGVPATFRFPTVIDTTQNSELFSIFGVAKGPGWTPGWLTAWSCNGELRYYYSLYQPRLSLDSVVEQVRSATSLAPALRSALHPEKQNVVIAPQGYRRDSIVQAYPQARHSAVIPIPETPATPLGWAILRISPRGRWFYFAQAGVTDIGGMIYDVAHQILTPLPIDSVFFRKQSVGSDSLFRAFLKKSYLQALITGGVGYDPCADSILTVGISYAKIEEIKIKTKGNPAIERENDTVIVIGKTNWTVFYDLSRNAPVQHIPEYDSSCISRFGFIDDLHLIQRVLICDPPLLIGTIIWKSYPQSVPLPDLYRPGAPLSANPTTDEFYTMARSWAIFDCNTGRCLALGGKIDINKKLLGIGYIFNPLMSSCPDAVIIHEPLTDYVTLVPDGISRPIKTYYAPELVHPTKQARYPATPTKIYRILAGARAWPTAVGITAKEYMLVWNLYEAGRSYEDSRNPYIWQRYERATGKLIGEWIVPRFQDGMRAQSMDFDGEGNLYVLYQDYRRSAVYMFNNQQ
ncbi:MAG: hypothetical protein AA908_06960 [Chlorobi bacterium NICIL-2]|jgi:hypothetical protein|nr:MAG: hypothetical protein AA908_06960 [Chlorobi bacterium NICIL-2]